MHTNKEMAAFLVPGAWTTVLMILTASFARPLMHTTTAPSLLPSPQRSSRPSRSALARMCDEVLGSAARRMLSGGGSDVGLGSDLLREYAGSLFGVSASASLDFRERQANVSLWGLPIAGSVNGSGWLESTTTAVAGKVVLDPDMEARLRRRGVRVVSAALDLPSDSLSVTVDVPIFGQQTLRLKRVLGE